ncbi:hypothetical protein DL990_14930 [Amycolatopsis sp. WAC 01416]|uniref:hypothetical protein n=1 Tax=unclassified Amycolatopsis TaxID=2618356 RepID=UPI000F797139|nr:MULTISPECIES: hypothetical protein [unclassified Amycolatopsis]RSN33281.1 hypothetical protein DL990_14930 [Amycolatopsis sp. WAC 01416]
MNVRSLATAAVFALIACLLAATPAQAATSVTFTPQTISVPKQVRPVVHSVTPVGTISLDMTATQTAYVVSKMRVNDATIRSLFDNEIVCRGPGGWSKNMVIGQNVYDTNSGSPNQDVTLYTRFLVHPGVAGTVTCTANVRGNSLSRDSAATYRLVSGYLTFADTSVTNATDGQPVQSSVSTGVRGLHADSPKVWEPTLDYFTLPSTVQGLNVVGDVELQVCLRGITCDEYKTTKVKFTLFVNQWKADGTLCKTDSSIQVTHEVPYWVHHKYVPLNKADFTVSKAPGCVPRFNAYVKAEWLGGEAAGIQGTATGLTDSEGSTTTHDSDMSHAYVLPY